MTEVTPATNPIKSALTAEAQAQLAQLAVGLANNPKTRKQFTKLVQEIDPSKRFPDVEVDDLRETIKTEFETRDNQTKADRQRERLEGQRKGLLGRYTEDQVKEIEKIMEDKGISDYDVAATYYGAIKEPVAPSHEIRSRTWQLPQLDKNTVSNIGAHSLNEAYKVIDEIKSNKKRA